MTRNTDIWGQQFSELAAAKAKFEIAERDDGYVGAETADGYFTDFPDWPQHVKRAIRYVHGSVLDIGCGAGRHSLYLQRKGFDVLGTDSSPLAIRMSRRRGVKRTKVVALDQLDSSAGRFDTILMLGGNFALFGSLSRARRLLKQFHEFTTGGATIIAESSDIHGSSDPCHRLYRERNLARGRMPGQLRIRIRYKHYKGPWRDYLKVSKLEMERILDGTGWKVRRYFDASYRTAEGPWGGGFEYVAIIDESGRVPARRRGAGDQHLGGARRPDRIR